MKPSKPFRSLFLAGAFTLLLLEVSSLGGCASAPSMTRVQPWQRATLASYAMRPDRDPLEVAMAEHIYFSRESASGGRGVGGSGCGCNE